MTFYIAQCKLDDSDHPLNHWLNSMFEDENGVIEFDTESEAVQAIKAKWDQYRDHFPDCQFRVICYTSHVSTLFSHNKDRLIEFYYEDN